ncbi:1,6-anhydro-N-acetylmuramyl-L-alanine amidase AmpD [Magnetococcales bacterium HHB-1]
MWVAFRILDSPHFNKRPKAMPVELLVVHAISLPAGQFGGPYIDDLFLGRLDCNTDERFAELEGLRVAAHFLIDRAGDITQYVPVMSRAWHAGKSVWRGRSACNDFSVGVELEGDWKTPFTLEQYRQLAQLTRTLQVHLPALKDDHIVGHEHIAPGRKWDPGPFFEWGHFRALLQKTPKRPFWPIVIDA